MSVEHVVTVIARFPEQYWRKIAKRLVHFTHSDVDTLLLLTRYFKRGLPV